MNESKDLAGNWKSFFKYWGFPVLIILGTWMAHSNGWISPQASGILWSIGILWIGLFCLKNALRCGRVHCWLVGTSFPLLALYALIITFGFVEVSWDTFWNIFMVVTILSFLPEWLGKKYFTNKNEA